MNGRETVKAVMEKTNKKNAELAFILGISQAALWDRLNSKKVKSDIATSMLVNMLRCMGYKVVAVPSNAKVPEDGIVID